MAHEIDVRPTYRKFIETCADVAQTNVIATRIREDGAFGSAEQRKVLLQLTSEQRTIVVAFLEESRQGAIHDLLARLEWMRACDDFKMSWKGADLSSYGSLNHDYVGCLGGGDPWPEF